MVAEASEPLRKCWPKAAGMAYVLLVLLGKRDGDVMVAVCTKNEASVTADIDNQYRPNAN